MWERKPVVDRFLHSSWKIYEANSSGPFCIQIALVLDAVNILNLLPEI
jgi:hypothetical protein